MIVTNNVEPGRTTIHSRRHRSVLVVEPDPLTRWSIVNYLARWFNVESATTGAEASDRLTRCRLDAVVLSEDLPDSQTDALDAQAHESNPALICVRMVTDPARSTKLPAGSVQLEKPFRLAALARLLRVKPVY